MWPLIIVLLLALSNPVQARHGTKYANAGSSIGTNIGGVSANEWPFLNSMKMGQQWYTYAASPTGEEAYLYANCLDVNGYWTTPNCPTGTFTASISGTTMVVTAVGSAVAPWLGGTISGSGVTAGTKISSLPSGSGNGHISGTTLTIDNSGSGWTVGQQIFGYGIANNTIITALGSGAGGNGTYTVSVSQTVASAGSPTPITGTQNAGTTGTYFVSASQTVGSTTITEAQTFNRILVNVGVNAGINIAPYYPGGAGSWLLMYDGDDNGGASNFSVSADATAIANHSCAGGTCTDTLNVTPSGAGMTFSLNVPNPNNNANYVKNLRLVQTSQYNALSTADKASFNSGGIFFNPDWLATLAPFRTIRLMNYSDPDGSRDTAWSQRSIVGFVFWNDNIVRYQDVPWEVQIALANKLHAIPWLNMPFLADVNYNTQLATLVLNTLDPTLNVIIERGNEHWNFGAYDFSPNAGPNPYPTVLRTVVTQGISDFPSCTSTAYATCAIYEYIYKTVQMADAWNAVWTGSNASRLVPVMGGQQGNDAAVNQFNLAATTPAQGSGALWTGNAASHVKAVANAPYFMYNLVTLFGVPNAWTGDADGGLQIMYQDVMQGVLPSAVVSGNCGNGAGKSCGGPSAYTLTSGLALSGTPANHTCLLFTTNQASSNNPTIAVDSVAATPIQTNDAVGWNVNTVTAASWASTGGGQVTFTTTSAHLVTPGVQFTISGMTPTGYNGTYTAISGTTGSTLVASLVSNPGTSTVMGQLDAANITLPGSTTLDICYTSKTANGSQTATWQLAEYEPSSCASEFGCNKAFLQTAKTTADSFTGSDGKPIRLFTYEWGQNWTRVCPNAGPPQCGGAIPNPLSETLGSQVQTSPQIMPMYQQMMEMHKAIGVTESLQFADPGVWVTGRAYWGFTPGVYAAGNPTPRAAALYDFIRRTPCWWSGC